MTGQEWRQSAGLRATPDLVPGRWRRAPAGAGPPDVRAAAGRGPQNAVGRLVGHALSRAQLFRPRW
jgi:hypothetical protein